MGVYSNNRTSIGAIDASEIVANENYIGELGALQIAMDGIQNDRAIFEAVITQDFAEVTAIKEGVEDFEVITEASLGSFLDKVKTLAKKAWEKIKGLFKTFIAKFNNIIIRDNKKFVEKYKKEITAKAADLGKMKFKWSNAKSLSTAPKAIDEAYDIIQAGIDRVVACNNVADVDKIQEELSNGDYTDKAYAKAVKGSDAKSFAKDYHEYIFEDEGEVEGLKSSLLSEIMDTLTNSAKTIKNIEEANKKIDKVFTDTLKNIKKMEDSIIKNNPLKNDEGTLTTDDHKLNDKASMITAKTGHSTSKMLAQKRANVLYTLVSTEQAVESKVCSCFLNEVKFHIKQCRRVFAQAVAFNPKSVKENALLMQYVGESAEFDIESSFSDYSM